MAQFRQLKPLAIVMSVLLMGALPAAYAENADSAHSGHGGMNHQKMMGGMDHQKMMQQHGNMMNCGGESGGHKMCMTDSAEPLPLPTAEALNSLPVLKNESQQPGEVKITLRPAPVDVELSAGKKTTLWLYNNRLLPVIEAKVGDKIIVNVDNQLPEETTIHWHGLSVPPEQDGNPQNPIKAGATHTYEFTVTPAMIGSHWFHPHAHNLTAKQVYQGLAGLFIVRDARDPFAGMPEQNLFFSDLKLDKNGQIAPNSMMDKMNGREGQYALLNGQKQPVVTLNETQRWRLWNGNSARYLDLSFPADNVDAYLIASDGAMLEKPQKITHILLTPGERADIVVTPKSTAEFALTALAYDRQKMGMAPPEKDRVLATIKATKSESITLPESLRVIPSPPEASVKRELIYTEDNQMNFLINGKKHDLERIDMETKVGQVEEWEIFNNSHMDHNFHLHGTHFYVKEFELNGKVTKPAYKMLKDTINLKPYEKVRVITQQNEPGIRMYHCHILEHEDAGMMGQLLVK